MTTATARKDLREGDNLLNLIETYMSNVDKVAAACLEALQDPDNPDKLFIGGNATDTFLTYLEPDIDGIDRKKKATLQELLDKINHVTQRIELKSPDRVTTLLKASEAMNKHIHLFAELKGMLGNITINVTNQPVFIELTQVVIQALQPYPEALAEVRKHIQGLKLKAIKSPSPGIKPDRQNIDTPTTLQQSTAPIITRNGKVIT